MIFLRNLVTLDTQIEGNLVLGQPGMEWVLVVLYKELDGVGPVDNRPSPDQLHHFFNFF